MGIVKCVKKYWVYTISVCSKYTFHNFHSNSGKFWIYVEGVSWRDTFHNYKKMELYSDAFHNFLKIGFILKVSLKETLSTIFQWKFRILKRDILQFPKNKIILKVSSRDTFHNFHYLLKNFALYWKCLFKRHFPQFPYIVENFEFMLRHLPQKKKKILSLN